MFYFKFKIPQNKDGSVVSYSPGWCGTRDKCALNEVGLLYNDKELWGIGKADGAYVPPDVEVVDEKTALSLIPFEASEKAVFIDGQEVDGVYSVTNDGVWYGQKLAHRHDPEPVESDSVPFVSYKNFDTCTFSGNGSWCDKDYCNKCDKFERVPVSYLPTPTEAQVLQDEYMKAHPEEFKGVLDG